MPTYRILAGHVVDSLRSLPAESVHCVVTSPPYWALRDYGLPPTTWGDGWLGCLGLEPDPRDFVRHLVEVFGEVRRVLGDDGTLWLNMGDGYARNGGRGVGKTSTVGNTQKERQKRCEKVPMAWALQDKSLIGMPWRVAIALSEAGWLLRSENIWQKRSPMPETVNDRPSRSHEHVFLLTKGPRYFYDKHGGSEPASPNTHSRGANTRKKVAEKSVGMRSNGSFAAATGESLVSTRNMRTVWTLSTEPLKEKHFAAYPSKLVEKCLRAGISEGGVCSQCGKPRVRTVVKERVATNARPQ
jgi:DNA modification methylase